MKALKSILVWMLVFQLIVLPVPSQPRIITPRDNPLNVTTTGVKNLRLVNQSPDGTDVTLAMEFSYDGFGGATAMLVPVIEKKDQPGVSGWFGSDPVTVGIGKGPISVKVKFFNDEPGVPPQFTSDRIKILILNTSGRGIISGSTVLKTINWGSPDAKPVAAPVLPATDPAARARASERARQAAEEEKRAREQADLAAQSEARARAESEAREQARLRAEADARRLAEENVKAEAETKRIAELTARAEADRRAREEAQIKAETEAKRLAEERRLAEARAKAEAQARQEARLKAEQEEKLRLEAEARAKAEAQAREEARLKAEAESKRLAEAKRLADEKARTEAEAEARAKLEAEARLREEARLKAEAEAKRLAEEKRIAEAKAKAEAQAREEARLKAEAEAQARLVAETRAKAEADAREQAHLKAEAEAKRLAEEKRAAEELARREGELREQARIKAEAEAKRLAEEKRIADEKAKQEAEARRLAQEKLKNEAAARAKAEAEAKAHEQARIEAERQASAASAPSVPIQIATNLRTKITNVDVVNRSIDRSQMTIGVEYEYKDDFSKALLGVDVARSGEPQVSQYFSSVPAEIGKSRRNFALFPVKFQPPAAQGPAFASFATDKVLVYLQDASAHKFNLFPATMLLMWRAPGSGPAVSAPVAKSSSTLEFDDFKQNDLFSGYVTVKYNLQSAGGKIRARLFDSSNPKSAEWFEAEDVEVKTGSGLQLIKVAVSAEARTPSDVIKADTIEVLLLDNRNQVVATVRRQTPMTWARPK